jgi:lysozyme
VATQDPRWAEAIRITEELCIKFEGIVLKPYVCPAGIWTIGIGSTFYENGKPVTKDDAPITLDRAKQLLTWKLVNVFLPGVLRQCPVLSSSTPGARAAILDFSMNLGVGRLQTSTLRRKVNAQDWNGAKEQLMLWTRGGGRVLPGLVKRRAAEVALLP